MLAHARRNGNKFNQFAATGAKALSDIQLQLTALNCA
jgi:hypothetical protein